MLQIVRAINGVELRGRDSPQLSGIEGEVGFARWVDVEQNMLPTGINRWEKYVLTLATDIQYHWHGPLPIEICALGGKGVKNSPSFALASPPLDSISECAAENIHVVSDLSLISPLPGFVYCANG
jgi:hypothetical protein